MYFLLTNFLYNKGMPDISDLLGEFTSGITAGASQIGNEFKKVGQTAVSQVTGSVASPPGPADEKAIKDAAAKAGIGGANSSGDSNSVWGEFKKLGKSATSQVSGNEDVGQDALSKMTKKDKDFSDVEYAAVRAKVKQIYEEYEAKKKKEEAMLKQQKGVVEEQKKEVEELQQEKKKEEFIDPAIQRSRAEIKNYGAE